MAMRKDEAFSECKTRKATPEELERYFKDVKPLKRKGGESFADVMFVRHYPHNYVDRAGVLHRPDGSVIA